MVAKERQLRADIEMFKENWIESVVYIFEVLMYRVHRQFLSRCHTVHVTTDLQDGSCIELWCKWQPHEHRCASNIGLSYWCRSVQTKGPVREDYGRMVESFALVAMLLTRDHRNQGKVGLLSAVILQETGRLPYGIQDGSKVWRRNTNQHITHVENRRPIISQLLDSLAAHLRCE